MVMLEKATEKATEKALEEKADERARKSLVSCRSLCVGFVDTC